MMSKIGLFDVIATSANRIMTATKAQPWHDHDRRSTPLLSIDRPSNIPSDFTTLLLPSIGECVLEAGRGMWGEFRCATAADISFDDEMGDFSQRTCAAQSQ